MNFKTEISCSLYSIIEELESGGTENALEDLKRLRKVVGTLKKNDEALLVGGIHSKETLTNAETENRIIRNSNLPLCKIELK
jgi:hypothetical protein